MDQLSTDLKVKTIKEMIKTALKAYYPIEPEQLNPKLIIYVVRFASRPLKRQVNKGVASQR
jgi:hypothetical protein